MKKNAFLPALAALLVSAALLLPGCASQYGEKITKVNHYPQCYKPIEDLRNEENAVAKSTAAGAATGAVTGAIAGGIATGSWKGAVAGAAVGGAAGAVAGNAYGKAQQAKRDAAFFAEYAS